jgi:hypothetical protein
MGEVEYCFLFRGRAFWILLCKQRYLLAFQSKVNQHGITAASCNRETGVTSFSSTSYQIAVIDTSLISSSFHLSVGRPYNFLSLGFISIEQLCDSIFRHSFQ